MNLYLQDLPVHRRAHVAPIHLSLHDFDLRLRRGDMRFGFVQPRLPGFHGGSTMRKFLGTDGAFVREALNKVELPGYVIELGGVDLNLAFGNLELSAARRQVGETLTIIE